MECIGRAIVLRKRSTWVILKIRWLSSKLKGGTGDQWRDATVSSEFISSRSTSLQPIAQGGGFHCSDMLASSGEADATILAVQNEALESMKSWLSLYKSATAPVDVSEEQATPFTKRVSPWQHGAGVVNS